MGKSQKKKAMRRHNPVRVPDSHLPKGLASASQQSSKSNEILPIIQKMESPDVSERKWACVAVSNIIQNDPSTRRLLQGKNVVGALITRLTDSEEEVVIEAVGALRNLCVDGGYDICAEMYNKNILAPLKSFIPKMSTTLTQYLETPKVPDSVQRIVYDFSDNVITILWCLSETSNKALNAINDIQLVPFLMSFLAACNKLSLAPVTAAAQCLYVLTDDNWPAITDVRSDAGYLACLLSIARREQPVPAPDSQPDPRAITLAVLSAGILRNILPIPPPSAASFVEIDKDVILPLLQPVISAISLSEISNEVQELVQRQNSEPQLEKMTLHTPKSGHKTEIELQLENLEGKLRTVQLSLEILTGACATLPDPTPDLPKDQEDPEGDDDLDIDAQVDIEMDATEETTQNIVESPSFLTTLVAPLLALTQPTALSFPPLASQSVHPPSTSALSSVHISALECLNNIFLSLTTTPNPSVAADVNAGLTVWNGVWTALGLVGTQTGPGQEKRQEFWEVAVGVLWGVGGVWKGSLVSNAEQIDLLIQFNNSTFNPRQKTQCIGALECLAQTPTAIDANRKISEHLLSLLPVASISASLDTEPMIQAVSALIDIYSDETLPYDINFRQGNYLERLVNSVEAVRKVVKAIDRRTGGGRELRRRGEEVRENLIGFIKYRRDLQL
ncbi:armadillo-type protein [Crepidotus variabilis]|uniref:Armadillo-type protein n=1 Tax=Crepidotus variabilis TaxID=179855 RepID=A0A9P6EN31_9AGAR|nr:armadillo-type protein [Crepidotus variabilis]